MSSWSQRSFPTSMLGSLFPRCTTLRSLHQLHAQLIINGVHLSTIFASKLANTYFCFSSSYPARKVFDQIPVKNSHSWNTMLSGYLKTNNLFELLHLYKFARAENHQPDSFALVFAIRACTGLSLLKQGLSVHLEAIRAGLESRDYVAPALISMYVESGCLLDAEKVFNIVSAENCSVWNLLLQGYSRASMDVHVFDLFNRMRRCGLEVDPCSALYFARACGNSGAGKEGRAIHGLSIKKNFLEFGSNVYLQTALIDMYKKSGFIDFACKLFDEMPLKDVVVFGAMITGLAHCGKAYESLCVFRNMLGEEIMPNKIIFASVLLACSHLGALQQGKSVHGFMVRNGIELDVVTYSALLDMYAKCGSIRFAYIVFSEMPEKNVYTWSAMIGAYGMHGLCSEAIALFDRMKSENCAPNHVTFVSVLAACSHSGRVQEGRQFFRSMVKDHKITPTNEHYSCMVDLLGRAGLVDEAKAMVEAMPGEPSASVWGALLGACRMHKHIELAARVADKLSVLEPNQPGAHVLLCNVYAAAEMWAMVKKTREAMTERGIRKTAGFSTIEVDRRVYIFNAMDRLEGCHKERITEILSVVSSQMKELGYTPDLSFVCSS
ncbi:TPR-like protein [Dioscorea alata]|uniref:TPR-like protein n=1 Tax=Dioscorea alata TaxID=55571 RepID=A0ACB7V7N3_DIOAL|nr:TPR-like protein [Dioscorea alata]